MTKFEEELFNKVPCKFELTTEAEYKKTTLINHFKNWHSDDEYQELFEQNAELTRENNIVNQINSKLESQIIDLKSQLQQQALPVVPECVAEFVSGDETELSKADRIAYLLKSVEGDNYYLEEYLTNAGIISQEQGEHLYAWATNQTHETILELWNGYTVEKPQLFYLKNKLTTSYLALDTNTGYYEHWGEEIIPKLLNKQGYKLTFTQQEIDSMQTGSYEQIEVAE